MRSYAQKRYTRKPGVSYVCIKETEDELNIVLDKQYVEVMKIVNAPHYGSWLFHPIKDKNNLRKTFDDVVKNTNKERKDGLSEEYVVIGEDGSGNFLCMKSEENAIYYQDHKCRTQEKVFKDLKEFIENSEDF